MSLVWTPELFLLGDNLHLEIRRFIYKNSGFPLLLKNFQRHGYTVSSFLMEMIDQLELNSDFPFRWGIYFPIL